jgi:CheY-like chemotaxis protein
VRRHGGTTIVQELADALEPAMPRAALEELPVHSCLPVARIADAIVQLSTQRSAGPDRRRVLIVEDERVVALNLERQLTSLGYRVVASVPSGEEALRIAASVSPDVVLMDVQLAGAMRGTEAGESLWTRLRIPVVYATAYSDERTLANARSSMAYGFVVKPYRAAQIHAALRLALDRRDRELGADDGAKS